MPRLYLKVFSFPSTDVYTVTTLRQKLAQALSSKKIVAAIEPNLNLIIKSYDNVAVSGMIWISAFRIACTLFKRVNSHFKVHQRLVSVYKYNHLCMHRRNWVFLDGVSVNRLLPMTIIHFHEFFTRVIKLQELAQWAPSIIRSLQGLFTTNVSIFCLWLTTYESI